MKNRTETERKLLDAVTEVMIESGISGIGVNRVAEKAGCSKMLIYRYFGDMDGLVLRWAEENNYWIKKVSNLNPEVLGKLPLLEKKKVAVSAVSQQIDEVRASAVMRELLRWQLTEASEVGSRMMAEAEKRGLALTHALAEGLESGLDIDASVAVITSGIYYLALQADYAPVYNGVRLDTEEGWGRIKNTVGELMNIIFNQMETKNED